MAIWTLLLGCGCSDDLAGDTDPTDDSTSTSESDDSTTDDGQAPEAPVLELGFSQVKQFEFSWAEAFGAEYYQLLESADDGEPYVLVGVDVVGLSTTLTVPLHFRVNASYKLRACNEHGCTDSDAVAVTGELVEAIGYLNASNIDEEDHFGVSVALAADGNTLAIGAFEEDGIAGDPTSNAADDSGAVYVFVRTGQAWTQQAYVKADNADPHDQFGYSVALSADGNTLAVGAYHEASSATGIDGNQADNSALMSGAAYVFVRDGQAWTQQAYVKASNTETGDEFGSSVALSGDGDTLAVGTFYEDSNATGIDGNQVDNSAMDSGAVYVFVRTGDAWAQQAYVKASNASAYDSFGYAIALSGDGDTMAINAYHEASSATGIDGDPYDNSALDAGAVYVFGRAGETWSQQAYIKASNTGEADFFGLSVALSADGDTLAVGAHGEDSSATGIDGNQADDSTSLAGAAYVFVRDGQAWSQQAYVKASNTNGFDAFGTSVALSDDGHTLAVGAVWEDSDATGIDGNQADGFATESGAVYLFVRDGQAWAQQAYVKASNTHAGSVFGRSMALSGDGSTLAVGAYDSIIGFETGGVYLY